MMRFLGTLSALLLSSSIGILHAWLTPVLATQEVVVDDAQPALVVEEEPLPDPTL